MLLLLLLLLLLVLLLLVLLLLLSYAFDCTMQGVRAYMAKANAARGPLLLPRPPVQQQGPQKAPAADGGPPHSP